MSRHLYSRTQVLARAGELASRVGLTGLTIGLLALDLDRPKSSVAFYFRARSQFQLQVLRSTARLFRREVIRPAFQAAPGLARLRRLFEAWIVWDREGGHPGGCLFLASATEFDDRPGPVRDRLLRYHTLWMLLLRAQLAAALAAGTLPPDTDPDDFLQNLNGIMLAFHHADRFLRNPHAETRARRAFEALIGGERRR